MKQAQSICGVLPTYDKPAEIPRRFERRKPDKTKSANWTINCGTQYYLLIGYTLALLAGCSILHPQLTPVDREVLRSPPPDAAPHIQPTEGSLFSGESRNSLLFVDRKARLVNDVITIRVVEAASASGEATTATERDSSIAGSIDEVFTFNPDANVRARINNNFDGSGATSRKNSLTASISAVVREVLPNGNLYIEGKKEVIINNERQYIILNGIVRPEDIAPDNSITSDLIADARIEYSGRGVLADKQRPGWLGFIVDIVWPF